MDYQKLFINNFLNNRVKSRIEFELSHEKKRSNALDRFCHNVLDLINQDTIYLKSNKISLEDTIKEIKELTKSKQGYIISYDSDLDMQTLPIDMSIEKCFFRGMSQIIVFDEKVCFIKEEQVFDSPMKYILKR